MFGVLQGGCNLNQQERREWMAHVCGVCLALRRDHGQLTRLTTNYDAALLSVLYDAQADRPMARDGDLCLLRPGLRADVVAADQAGARFAASVSALIGATKLNDHVADGEGWPRYLPTLSAGLAGRWGRRARHVAETLGFQAAEIQDQVARQPGLEQSRDRHFSFFAQPTELAVGAAFGHTAVLAGRPANVDPLDQIGRMYGRIMYLLDSYRDYAADLAGGKFNALARCFMPHEVQGQAGALFRAAHAALAEAFDRLALARPALARRLLVTRLRQIGEETLGDPVPQGQTLAGVLPRPLASLDASRATMARGATASAIATIAATAATAATAARAAVTAVTVTAAIVTDPDI